MYTSFHIKNFRGFEDLELNDLARVNLIGGKNNTGKTALLEALYLHARGYDVRDILDLDSVRGLQRDIDNPHRHWMMMFNQLNTTSNVELKGFDTKIGHRSLRLRQVYDIDELSKLQVNVPPDRGSNVTILSSEVMPVLALDYEEKLGPGSEISFWEDVEFTSYLMPGGQIKGAASPPPILVDLIPSRWRQSSNIVAQQFTQLILSGGRDVLLHSLQQVDPRISRVELLDSPQGSILHAEIGLGRPMPFAYMGEAVNRLANFVTSIVNRQNGIVLIDEIENGLHYSILADVWKIITHLAHQFNVQIFATTHSLEMIRAAHEAFKESEPYDFRYLRLYHSERTNTITVKHYDEEIMEAAVDSNFEVR